MSKKLAIKGHSTRVKEVIELLEMMGGINDRKYIGTNTWNDKYYFLDDRYIRAYDGCDGIKFTLKEFLEKYPYKVGDKVEVCETGKVFTIGNMIWEDELCTVYYVNMEDFEYYTANELKPYKETNMKENKCTQCVYAVNNNHCGLRGFRSNFNVNYCSAQNIDKLPNGFELQEDGYFSWVNKKPKYPTTFEECCNILYCKSVLKPIIGHKAKLLFNLEMLLICRDAYWKIAGEQMGLDEPWKFDMPKNEFSYTISYQYGYIQKNEIRYKNAILVFPTKEMRDAFYENFKDLIEQCKELL